MRKKNILVTGGCGFIGWNFINYLYKQTELEFGKIVNLDILNYAAVNRDKTENFDDRYIFVRGDICSDVVFKILSKHDIDYIVHFAAQTHVCNSIEGPEPFLHSNIMGTYNILEQARYYWSEEGKKDVRMILISTDEVYGSVEDQNGKAFTEETPYHPNNPYAASKAAADHITKAYVNTYKFPAIVTNCSNNYGPGQHEEKLIPRIIDCCVKQKPIPLHGDGQHQRDWIFVEDHCRGILTALLHGKNGESYLFGTNINLTNLEITHRICEYMDKTFPDRPSHFNLISFVADRPGYDHTYRIDYSKVYKEFGWEPNIKIEEGLIKTVNYYLKQHYPQCILTDEVIQKQKS